MAARVAGLEVSAAALVDSSRGLGLTSVPGVDLSGSEVRRHQRDMSNPLGVPSRVCDGSSKVRNGGADLGAGNSPACDVPVPGWSTASKI